MAWGQRLSAVLVTVLYRGTLDQRSGVEHGIVGVFCLDPYDDVEPSDEELADLARATVWFALLGLDNQPLDLFGELVGIAHRAPRPIRKRDRPYLIISVEDFVAGLSGYHERQAPFCHDLAVQKPSHKPHTFFFTLPNRTTNLTGKSVSSR